MKVKDLYQVIKDTVEKDSSVLELDVCSQIAYDKYYDSVNPGVGHMEDNSFIVEKHYEDPSVWLSEMGSDFTNLEDYMDSDESSRMKRVFYIDSTS